MARTQVEIQKEILDELAELNMTTHGVATAINSHYSTAEKHLEELANQGRVVKEGDKWRLNR